MCQPSSAIRRSTAGRTRSKSSPIDSPRRNLASFGMTPRNACTNSCLRARPPESPRGVRPGSREARATTRPTTAGRDDRGGLERSRQAARDDAVEVDAARTPRATACACCDALVVERHLGRVHGRAVGAEVRHLGVAHEVEAAAHRRNRIARCASPSADIVETAADADGPRRSRHCSSSTACARSSTSTASGSGDVRARRIGEGGGSNFTFLLERGSERFVLRRPPRPPLPPSAHDVVREAQAPARAARGRVRAAADDRRRLRGREPARRAVLRHDVPRRARADGRGAARARDRGCATCARRRSRRRPRRDPRRRRRDARSRRHSRGPGATTSGRSGASRSSGRSTRRASFPQVDEVGERLADERARSAAVDRRARRLPARKHDGRAGPTRRASSPCSTGRWARSATRAPTSATCSRRTASRAAPPNPLGTSPITALAGFPSRAELVERYVARSGRDVEPLAWFEALALWKAAVFCEAIYGRYVRGELGAEDTRAARFEQGVPYLAEAAAAALGRADPNAAGRGSTATDGCEAAAFGDLSRDLEICAR